MSKKPSRPLSVTADTALTTSEKLVIKWNKPETDRGASINEYKIWITEDVDDGKDFIELDTDSSLNALLDTYTITKYSNSEPLKADSAYIIYIVAGNSNGWGDDSDEIRVESKKSDACIGGARLIDQSLTVNKNVSDSQNKDEAFVGGQFGYGVLVCFAVIVGFAIIGALVYCTISRHR